MWAWEQIPQLSLRKIAAPANTLRFGGCFLFCFVLFHLLGFLLLFVWTIFKDLIEFVTILLLFRVYFFLFGPKACRILGPWTGMELDPPVLTGGFLTTEPLGKPIVLFTSTPQGSDTQLRTSLASVKVSRTICWVCKPSPCFPLVFPPLHQEAEAAALFFSS